MEWNGEPHFKQNESVCLLSVDNKESSGSNWEMNKEQRIMEKTDEHIYEFGRLIATEADQIRSDSFSFSRDSVGTEHSSSTIMNAEERQNYQMGYF